MALWIPVGKHFLIVPTRHALANSFSKMSPDITSTQARVWGYGNIGKLCCGTKRGWEQVAAGGAEMNHIAIRLLFIC